MFIFKCRAFSIFIRMTSKAVGKMSQAKAKGGNPFYLEKKNTCTVVLPKRKQKKISMMQAKPQTL